MDKIIIQHTLYNFSQICDKCNNIDKSSYYFYFDESKPVCMLCPNCFQLNKLDFYKNYKVEYCL